MVAVERVWTRLTPRRVAAEHVAKCHAEVGDFLFVRLIQTDHPQAEVRGFRAPVRAPPLQLVAHARAAGGVGAVGAVGPIGSIRSNSISHLIPKSVWWPSIATVLVRCSEEESVGLMA